MRLGLAGAAIALVTAAAVQDADTKPIWWGSPVKMFSQRSPSMFPTLRPVSLFIAHKQPGSALRRGDVIVFQQGDGFWNMRVAGLPGDRITVADGHVSINGRPAVYGKPEPIAGTIDTTGMEGTFTQRSERFEGEGTPHLIIDMDTSRRHVSMKWSDFPGYVESKEALVLPGHVFVLGDNRDDANDSRQPKPYGPGQIAFADIYGVADRTTIRWAGPPSHEVHGPIQMIYPAIPTPPK